MPANSSASFAFLAVILAGAAACSANAQGTMHRSVPQSATTDSDGHLKKDDTPGEAMVRGLVVLVDGSAPRELVSLYCDCGGVQTLVGVADSKGAFSFNQGVLDVLAKAKECALRSFLEGYRSETKPLSGINSKSGKNFGKLVLQPLTPDTNGLLAPTDDSAGKAPKKDYEKALNEAAKGEFSNAIVLLQKATAAYPDYSSAWLSLGSVQQSRGDHAGAEKAFREAVRADPKFALPLVQLAALEAARGDWREAVDHSQKAIDLNAAAFPDAYALNAMGNVSLQKVEAAEKSAREGLKLDTTHQYPELEYALGIVLYSKSDIDGAAKMLQAYLDQAPNGPNAEGARNQLAEMRNAAAAEQASAAKDQTSPLNNPETPVGPGPAASLLLERNAPLLVRTPTHTCLESISRIQIDSRGRPHDPDMTRVQIAVSDDKEIYGYVGGKRFSNERLADMLGYTFSTTGLFSSIAREVIAGNQVSVAFAGKDVLNGESVFRYNFRSLPSEPGWSIQYGKESGKAREEGWFLVDSANLLLRRVVVHAVSIPRNLKLTQLDAVIDYEPETIADRRILLPYLAEVHVGEGSGTQRVGRMFFNHCGAFTAEATLSFDVDDTQVQGKQPRGNPDLPPDLNVVVSLRSPVSSATAALNDLLTATVTVPVVWKGHEIISRGAVLEGHVLSRHGENAVTIEFDRVQTRDGWAPFYAHLVSLAAASHANAEGLGAQNKGSDPEIPGVVKIDFTSESASLTEGTQMTWKTEPLAVPTQAKPPQLSTSMNMR